ncbi:MAG: cytochrome c biogenesis CcdA family protein, partial [Candidatus Magasanikbacteria bacterium]
MNKKIIGAIALTLFIIVAGGLVWLAAISSGAVSAMLSFAAGLSMIFLPCTLPLAFVIVPIAAKEEAGKGIGLAVAFGLGLTVTITIYGIITAVLGNYFGLDQFTRIMFTIAGAAALIFGLSELNLINISLPVATSKVPNWIKEGYGKTFLLGLFLGNAGIGCPNPAFYVLLTYIASTGSLAVGGWLGFVHGLGRAAPLILLVLLALLGVKSSKYIKKSAKKVHLWTGAALVAVGAFILTYGLFGMHWWEDSVFHASWNNLMLNIDPALAEKPDHPVAQGIWKGPMWLGWWSLTVLILAPMVWYYFQEGMSKVKFWIITAVLILLSLGASSGILRVEHAHGTAVESRHNSQERIEDKKEEKIPEHEHEKDVGEHTDHIHEDGSVH